MRMKNKKKMWLICPAVFLILLGSGIFLYQKNSQERHVLLKYREPSVFQASFSDGSKTDSSLLLSQDLCVIPKNRESNPQDAAMTARASLMINDTESKMLYSHNIYKKVYPASITKIVTALVALKYGNLDDTVTFSYNASHITEYGAKLCGFAEGDQIALDDLLHAFLICSGNDAGVAIAEHIAGSTSEFVTMMNDLSRKIGATNSHFANTHGLDADGHYTTAYDLALITSYALENDTFREIVSTKNTRITKADGEHRYLKNKNKLLFTLDGCIGVKTGFTDDAGRCLVSAAERDGMRVVCVVLNCGPMFPESADLLTECLDTYKLVNVTDLYDFKREVEIVDGRKNAAKIGVSGEFVYPLSQCEVERLKFAYTIPQNLQAPLEKGTEIGKTEIFLDNNLLFSQKIFTIEDIKPKSVLQRVKEFFANW